ncbi:glycoside hydrolase family 75 protein [Rubritalea marina]|uniref:glycoside hydrolase family 75 protein n=1 Tax=Rubritalea marina TaxID=361055 RepID=UPI00036AAEA0|nr:glycoside hydrolase family 75 protein [Rubritalea marina]
MSSFDQKKIHAFKVYLTIRYGSLVRMKSGNMMDEANKSQKQGFPYMRASFFVIVVFAAVVSFTTVPERLKDCVKEIILAKREAERMASVEPELEIEVIEVVEEETREPEVEEVVEAAPVHAVEENPAPVAEAPNPEQSEEYEPGFEPKVFTPKPEVDETRGDMVRLSKGFHFKYELETEAGGLASEIRNHKDSYVAEYKMKMQLPKASTTLDDLESVNPELGSMLPGLEASLEGAEISKFFEQIYENKLKRVERDVLKLNVLITKHNFFDCETILNLKHPESGRKFLLVQGDMDVVSDGSDGDRLALMPRKIVESTHYQPFTSYGWKKQSKTPNPMVKGWEKRIGNAKRELADPKTTDYRKQWLKDRMKMLRRGIDDMKARSFLIAEYDPFIVMPVNVITDRSDPYAARVGDYAVVIVGDTIYPAIVGDGGPTYKVGEASLRMAKEINEKANPYRRPVSDLTVSYIVFSHSREKVPAPPNYAKWREKCAQLLGEIGGLGDGYTLHEWKDLLKKEEPKPVPAPTAPAEANPETPTPAEENPEAPAAESSPSSSIPTEPSATPSTPQPNAAE